MSNRDFVVHGDTGPTQAEFEALKAKVDRLIANKAIATNNANVDVNHLVRRELAPHLVDLEAHGFSATGEKGVTTNAKPATTNYLLPESE